ncbi:MAG: hypothetical protein ACLUPG_19225 [Roseburia faecis]
MHSGKRPGLYVSHKARRRRVRRKSRNTNTALPFRSAILCRPHRFPECRLSYEVFGDGRVKTTLCYDPVKELGDMPEFGVLFKFNADYDRLQWYGLGRTGNLC